MHPLPFHNGAYWVDNSTLSDFCRCAREYQYATLVARINAFNKAALNYGAAVHKALAALVATCGSDYSKVNLAGLDQVLAQHFEENPQPPDDHRQLGLAQETMRRYISTYEIEPWKVAAIDGHPLLERLLYCQISEYNGIPVNYFALIDLSVIKPDGYWIVDRKTTSRMGEDFRYEHAVSDQMSGYLWMFEQCFGVRPIGYIIDGIRTLSPTVTAIKGGATTLSAWWAQQFQRLPFYNDTDRVEEWLLNTKVRLALLFRQVEDGYLPVNRHQCVGKYGRCQFYDICTLPRQQRLVALASNNFVDNDWVERTLKGKIWPSRN